MNGFALACLLFIGAVFYAHNSFNGAFSEDQLQLRMATTTPAFATSTIEYVREVDNE